MKIENMTSSRGNKVANQFIIVDAEHNGQIGAFFQSYNTMIAFRSGVYILANLNKQKAGAI